MRIRNQKKISCTIGALAALVSMIFLTEGVHGLQALAGRIQVLEGETQLLTQKLQQQEEKSQLREAELKSKLGAEGDIPIVEEFNKLRASVDEDARTLKDALGSLTENLSDIPGVNLVRKVGVLKETLVAAQEEKGILEQKHRKTKNVLAEIKRTTGGSGTGTPIIPRLQKLRNISEIAKLLEEKLCAIPGDSVEDKVVALEETLEANQEEKEKLTQQYVEMQRQIAELKLEIGGEEDDTPTFPRMRKLSNSLKKDTGNLKEAVNALTEKLEGVSGEDCVDKVGELVAELADTKEALHILAQKLQGIPGDGLVEKLEVLMTERQLTQEILGNMQETIIDKEEAYRGLYIELLRAQSEVNDLDAELSKAQVAQSVTKEQLNHVLGKQFNY